MATIQQLALSEQDMQTKALPDEAPGDVSDAKSKVIADDMLQSPDDWGRIQAQLDSGELDADIAAEEDRYMSQATPTYDQEPRQRQQGDQGRAPQQDSPQDIESDDDNDGSSPPDISLFGELQPDPRTGVKIEQKAEPVFNTPPPQQTQAPEEQDQNPDESPGGGSKSEPNHPGGTQYRFRGDDEVEELAFHLKRKAQESGNTLHLEQALKLARETIGTTGQQEVEDNVDDDGLPGSVDDARAEIRRLEDEELEAMEEMEFDKVREIRSKVRLLQDSIPKVEERQNQRQTAYVETFNASQSKAAKLYPAFTQEGDFAKACAQMDELLKEENDPRFHDPQKPILIARAVAQKMGIMPEVQIEAKPATPNAPASAPSPRARYQAAPTVPISGQSRSGGTTTPAGGADYSTMDEDAYHSLKDQWSN